MLCQFVHRLPPTHERSDLIVQSVGIRVLRWQREELKVFQPMCSIIKNTPKVKQNKTGCNFFKRILFFEPQKQTNNLYVAGWVLQAT